MKLGLLGFIMMYSTASLGDIPLKAQPFFTPPTCERSATLNALALEWEVNPEFKEDFLKLLTQAALKMAIANLRNSKIEFQDKELPLRNRQNFENITPKPLSSSSEFRPEISFCTEKELTNKCKSIAKPKTNLESLQLLLAYDEQQKEEAMTRDIASQTFSAPELKPLEITSVYLLSSLQGDHFYRWVKSLGITMRATEKIPRMDLSIKKIENEIEQELTTQENKVLFCVPNFCPKKRKQ